MITPEESKQFLDTWAKIVAGMDQVSTRYLLERIGLIEEKTVELEKALNNARKAFSELKHSVEKK